jgi:phosphatidate cytidylyltransferase
MGGLLALLAAGVLVVDQWMRPYHPFLLVFLLFLACAGCQEMVFLIPYERRPARWLCLTAVTVLILANWPPHLLGGLPWDWLAGTFAVVVLSCFLMEMALFREPGEAVTRMALAIWLAAYLGFLPGFFAQLGWLGTADTGDYTGTLTLAAAIFVPKGCDIGAYFAGRFLGRHPMTPFLSPKKTWEGLAGGLAASMLIAFGLGRIGPIFRCDALAAGFGLTVGLAGVLGDLAESLIKRDCRKKDAGQAVPGFGGVLDVVDSVLFAAPVVYGWFRLFPPGSF